MVTPLTDFSSINHFPFYLGTKSPYPYESTEGNPYSCTSYTNTPPPPGYQPFYINYLGRHGARYLESKEQLTFLIGVLEKNKVDSNLTDAGFELLSELKRIEEIEENRYGGLTPYGADMLKGIANRMYHEYPSVFGKKLYAESTYVQRVIDSMFTFLGELFLYIPPETAIISSNGEIDPILRFFDINVAYVCYKDSKWWEPMIEKYQKCCNPSVSISQQFFTYPIEEKILLEFAPSLFNVLIEEFDLSEPPYNAIRLLYTYFTDRDRYFYWEKNNLTAFYKTGPSCNGIMLPTNISFALLRNFIETSDSAIKTGEISANLRFAHAETIIPFASILKLSCCSKQTNSLPHVSSIWRDYEIASMAANIAWIFYKHPDKDEILVKMTYNEQEICFPFCSTHGPYASWNEVRAYYCSLLDSLCIDCSQSVIEQVSNYTV